MRVQQATGKAGRDPQEVRCNTSNVMYMHTNTPYIVCPPSVCSITPRIQPRPPSPLVDRPPLFCVACPFVVYITPETFPFPFPFPMHARARPHGPMDQEFQVGMGRYVVGLCFGIEHVLLALVAVLWVAIPAQPKWVRQRIARVHFLREKGARQAVLKKQE